MTKQTKKDRLEETRKYAQKLKKRGVHRKTLDFDKATLPYFEEASQRFRLNSAKQLMELILDCLVQKENGVEVIHQIIGLPIKDQ